jgi:hypothetical protein
MISAFGDGTVARRTVRPLTSAPVRFLSLIHPTGSNFYTTQNGIVRGESFAICPTNSNYVLASEALTSRIRFICGHNQNMMCDL